MNTPSPPETTKMLDRKTGRNKCICLKSLERTLIDFDSVMIFMILLVFADASYLNMKEQLCSLRAQHPARQPLLDPATPFHQRTYLVMTSQRALYLTTHNQRDAQHHTRTVSSLLAASI